MQHGRSTWMWGAFRTEWMRSNAALVFTRMYYGKSKLNNILARSLVIER
jgi:hypothetical protein